MEKLVTGPEAADAVDIGRPIADNIRAIARAKGSSPHDVTVCILDRPRHEGIVKEVREAGARIKFILDGDVAGAIMACRPGTGVDLLLGIGGTPEGIIAACAIKALGGVIQGRLWPQDDAEKQQAKDAGHELGRVLMTDDLVTSDDVFFAATGITDGELVDGVRYGKGKAVTHSLVMRSRSGTIRTISSEHQLGKLRAYSAINFDTAVSRRSSGPGRAGRGRGRAATASARGRAPNRRSSCRRPRPWARPAWGGPAGRGC
jgi:fructose-1,6-bisphosphatase II